ncbi:MAG: hypothetical protein H7X95_07330, partial [Deltaproteobacteria bacterium]|nr:hypothetical protein [Deltaproteobacteria bacterium]
MRPEDRDRDQPATPVRRRPLLAGSLAAAAAVVLVGLSFIGATTFIGDDHLFAAFARYAPNPLRAFVRDQHGGEFYRPIPMLLWWILGRAAPGTKVPFAVLSFALHLVVSLQVGVLVNAIRSGASDTPSPASMRTAVIAGTLFFLAPVTQEAAFWYAASTDLLATAFGVGAVIALLHQRPWRAACLFAVACWSKESALAIPALSAVALCAQAQVHAQSQSQVQPGQVRSLLTRIGQIARPTVFLLPVAAAYFLART